MKVFLGIVVFLLGTAMLFSSFKVQSKINDFTQNTFVGIFEFYNKFIKEHPAVQSMTDLMNLDDAFKDTLTIAVSVLFIILGAFLILRYGTITPLVGAAFLGLAIIAITFCLRIFWMHQNQ